MSYLWQKTKGLNYPARNPRLSTDMVWWFLLSFHNHQTTTLHFQRHWEVRFIGCWKWGEKLSHWLLEKVRKVRTWPKILTDHQETQNLHELTHPKNDIRPWESPNFRGKYFFLGLHGETSQWHPLPSGHHPVASFCISPKCLAQILAASSEGSFLFKGIICFCTGQSHSFPKKSQFSVNDFFSVKKVRKKSESTINFDPPLIWAQSQLFVTPGICSQRKWQLHPWPAWFQIFGISGYQNGKCPY